VLGRRDVRLPLRDGLIIVWAALFAVFGLVSAAGADPGGSNAAPKLNPMTIVLVRSANEVCEPNCPQWISAQGDITAATPALLRRVLKQAGKARPPIVIRSGGGDLDAAMAMGRLIRERKLDVAVGFTSFQGCAPGDKTCKPPREHKGVYRGFVGEVRALCLSACPLILAAGTERVAFDGAFVGVHQVKTTRQRERVLYRVLYRVVNGKKRIISQKEVKRTRFKPEVTIGFSKALKRKTAKYLGDMGIDLAILDDMDKAPPSDIFHLAPERLDALNLRTTRRSLASLLDPAACALAAPPASCVADPAAARRAREAKRPPSDRESRTEGAKFNPSTARKDIPLSARRPPVRAVPDAADSPASRKGDAR
jgi:hypothetical protein